MTDRPELAALLEDSAEDLYEHAPCGYLSTTLDGQIVKINQTLLDWLGRTRSDVVGLLRFAELLTVGGRLYHETHFAPLLRMQGELGGVALELRAANGERLPVLVTSRLRTDSAGTPILIRTTVFDARDRRAYEQELLRARRAADQERARVQELATTLQRTLLPPALPDVPGVSVAAHYHPASADQVGGDFYDMFPLAAGRWGVFLGDVCGKGARAAAVTSLTRYTLRSAAVYDQDPAAVVHNLNTVLHQDYRPDDPQFCTVTFGVLTPAPGGCVVELASGGHPPALLIRADGSVAYQPTPGGQLVGMLPNARVATTTVTLFTGDTLLLYSDGLTEARIDTARHRLGEDGLLNFARGTATTAPALITAITELLATLTVDDDVAALALSV